MVDRSAITDEGRAQALAEIEALRRRIDLLDQELVRLLNARASCALEIGRLKEALGLPIYQPEREREVLAHVRAVNPGPLDEAAVVRLFERVIDEARRLERLAQQARNRL
jgi:chorismate mutase